MTDNELLLAISNIIDTKHEVLKKELEELKEDTANLRSELKEDIADLRSELKEDIADLRSELKGDTANLRSELKSDISGINIKLDKLESETSALKNGQLTLRKDIKAVSGKVDATYELALDAWGKSTENRVIIEGAL